MPFGYVRALNPKHINSLDLSKTSEDGAESFASQYQALLVRHQTNPLLTSQNPQQPQHQQTQQQQIELQTIPDYAAFDLKAADLIIDLATQRLFLPKLQKIYVISSGKKGIGEREGSGQTPRGWHHVCEKFGADAPQNAVFVARQWTGEVYNTALAQQFPERDWILSRILWLDGLQAGFNQGDGIDSKSRYIYIHGTPDSEPMGVPCSHGCIRMRNRDVIELFARVPLSARVCILA